MAIKYLAKRRSRVYLKEWLEHLDVSQVKLADRMDTDKANVSRWLKYPDRITLDVLSGAALALGIETGELFLPPEKAVARRNAISTIREANTPLLTYDTEPSVE